MRISRVKSHSLDPVIISLTTFDVKGLFIGQMETLICVWESAKENIAGVCFSDYFGY